MSLVPDRTGCDECQKDDKMFVCLSGLVYGPCEYDECYSWCMNWGECECGCHG